MEQIVKQEPLIERAMTIEEAFLLAEEERYNYELREKGRADYDSAMSWSLKQGRQEGIQQGLQKGIQKGRREGRREGRQIREKEMARKMLKKNMSLEDICDVTGLPPEEIKKL